MCGALIRPSLSALWCQGDAIPLRSVVPGRSHPFPLAGVGTIPSFSDLRCRARPSLFLCDAGVRPSVSALRCQGDPILHRSTVPGRSHPSPLCVAGAIHPSPLYGAVSVPSLSALWYRGDTIPQLCVAGVIPSLSALRCRGDPIPLRFTVSGQSHPSPLCGVGARPSFSDLR